MSNEYALIVKYHFDEDDDSINIKDGSNNNLHTELKPADETINGIHIKYDPPNRTDGFKDNGLDFQRALEFAGKELLKIDHNEVLNPDKITVMAWVLYHDLDDNYKGENKKELRLEILEKFGGYWINIRTGYDFSGKLNPENRGKIRFGFGNSNGNFFLLDSNEQISPNEWYHVAGSFDGKLLKIFIDGAENSKKMVSESITKFKHPLTIGGRMTDQATYKNNGRDLASPPPDAFFYGKIDEVRIYGDALSEADIKKMKDIAGPVSPPSAPPAAPTGFRIVSKG